MRIGESTIYSPTYNSKSRQGTSDALAGSTQAPTTTSAVGVEQDMSAKSLSGNLWMLQTDIFYSKDAEKIAADKKDLAAEFSELSEKSLAERIRDEYLEKHGMTEEDLAALPDEERKAVEDEIQQLIKRQLGLDENAAAEQATEISG